MREVSHWDASDLQSLIAGQVKESISIEYKRADALARTNEARNELSKDVSAFANSAGGKIIYGIIEANNLPVAIDKGVSINLINREWVEQVIGSLISPRVQGITIQEIPIENDNFAYVIDVPQATVFGPHQASDKKYYRRFNFMSVPMEDYEIRDALRRGATGHPVAWFEWRDSAPKEDGTKQNTLAIKLTNLSAEPVLYAAFTVHWDQRLSVSTVDPGNFRDKSGMFADMGDRKIALTSYDENIMPTNHMPIFKEQTWLSIAPTLVSPEPGDYFLGYSITCPGFSESRGGMFRIEGSTISAVNPIDADLLQRPTRIT